MTIHQTIAPLHQLLKGGFPTWMLEDQARGILTGLERLPADTEGRDEAISAVEKFIAELPVEKPD